MLRKTLTIFSLLGLLLSVGAWGVSYWNIACYSREGGFAFTSGTVRWSNNPATVLFAVHRPLGVVIWGSSPSLPTDGSYPITNGFEVIVACGKLSDLPERLSWYSFSARDEYNWSCIGYFDFQTEWTPKFEPIGLAVLPLWMPTLLLGLLLSFSWLVPLHRRRKRKKLGLCVKCGYDLRGSEERCPECGEQFADENARSN